MPSGESWRKSRISGAQGSNWERDDLHASPSAAINHAHAAQVKNSSVVAAPTWSTTEKMQTRKEQTAVFAACARDCANTLPSVLLNMERMSLLYEKATFVFVENDSRDNTKDVLREWCSHKDATILNLDGLDGFASKLPVRTLRLAHARQKYIDAVKSHFAHYNHLIVFDCDEINAQEIDLNVIERAIAFLESQRSYAGVFANQDGVYYDLWALRHKNLCPGDVWEEALDAATNDLRLTDLDAYNNTVAKRIFSLPANADPVEVDSAFGGFGIYKINSILRNRRNFIGFKEKTILTSTGVNNRAGWQVCEHVSFNAGFREQGESLFILPYLMNATTTYNPDSNPSAFRSLIFDIHSVASNDFMPVPVSRNNLCPCGSGKRYKHCHGAFALN